MEAFVTSSLRLQAPNPRDRVDLTGAGPAAVERYLAATELWLRLRPARADQVQGLIWHGRLLRFAREHAKGVGKLREALSLDPGSFDARYALALAIAEDSPEESMRHLKLLRAHK